MRHKISFLVPLGIALCFQCTFSGCDSTDPVSVSRGTEPEQDLFESGMSATIGGSKWVASSAVATDVRIDTDIYLSIRGVANLGDAVTLLFNRPIETRTYVIRGDGLVAQQYRSSGASASDIFESTDTGTVTFTYISEKRLEGSFSFDADRVSDSTSVSVKGGRFIVGF